MDVAFTIDDLPLWPQSDPPRGFTAAGIVSDIRKALALNGIVGVYAFCNSWPLDRDPSLARVLDDWVADGHHVANHTHSHLELPDVTAEAFVADIDLAETRLAPWIAQSPRRLFRHPLCYWGETPDKLRTVTAHLDARGLTPVDVTSFSYEWVFNRAWRAARETGDRAAETWICDAFLTFVVAQLRHDQATAAAWFGAPITAIALGHNVPFFAVVAQEYFTALRDGGARFVPLDRALAGPVQRATCSLASPDFLVLQQKLARMAGTPIPRIAADQQETFDRVTRIASDRSD